MQALLILILWNVFPPRKKDREVLLAFSKGKVVMDSAIREGAGAPRVIKCTFPKLPNGPRVPTTPWFPIFYPLKKVKYDLLMVHLKRKDVQCLV